jgi:hypothetical protein
MLYEPRTPIYEQPARGSGDNLAGSAPAAPFPTSPPANNLRPLVVLSPHAALAVVMMTIDRVERVIDEETRELRSQKVANLRDFNNRKSQGLLELSRAMRGLGEAARDRRLQAKLTQLRSKIDENLSLLSMHLAAVQEVSTIISRAIQDAESDGTYSAGPGSEGPRSC